MTNKSWILAGLLLAAAMDVTARPVAVPGEVELETAREQVELLTKQDYQAVKDGAMTRIQLGDKMVDYAALQEIPAKYLLLRAAFRQYLLAEDSAKAYDFYRRTFAEYGADFAISIAKFSMGTLTKISVVENAAAQTLVDRVSTDVNRGKYIDVLRETAARGAVDPTLAVRIGNEYVALGDWRSALREFAGAEGEYAQAAAFELDYPRVGATLRTSADQANLWWRCSEDLQTPPAAAANFRRRAAHWYALAITNGVARGVRRTMAESRVKEVSAANDAAAMREE